jgi:protease I
MTQQLKNHKVAIVVENGFEQVELTEPRKALEEAGARIEIVSPVKGKVKGWQTDHWGDEFPVDKPISEARSEDYDALLLPGGVMNADKLRRNENVLNFVRGFFDSGKPVASICHAPWTLIDSGVARGRRMTSWPSLQMDLKNAGVDWVDREVVVDRGLVTSRKPADIPVFNERMIEEFAEGLHGGQKQASRERIHVPESEKETVPHI